MCGIVGYAGIDEAAPILLNGLKKLEYRGYDSSGISVINSGQLQMLKTKGRLKNLVEMTNNGALLKGTVGIGHTRWATHGEPSDINSHPHISNNEKFMVVHNGIIENYLELKAYLQSLNFDFKSETDTEVIAHLIEHYYDGDMIDTLIKVTHRLKGSYALGVLHSGSPLELYAVRKDSPLVIGVSDNANFIASDMPALISYTRNFILMNDNEIAKITKDSVKVFNRNYEEVETKVFQAEWDIKAAEKGGYEHFMLKEIHEQPKALEATLRPRINEDKIVLDKINLTEEDIKKIKRINIIACGSAYHAGVVGKYYIENLCRIPVEADLASEFRYRNPIVDENSLTIVISQSGETADTLAALREAKKRGSRILSIVNVVGSSIVRESDDVLYTWAGPEIAVATTKGYTCQVAALHLIGLYIANALKIVDAKFFEQSLKSLMSLPKAVEEILSNNVEQIQYLAANQVSTKDAFFIGRNFDYAASLEAALKLKEISYIHAEAYAAGELKHGTISLIEPNSLVFATATDPILSEKTLSNIKEVKSRGAFVIAVIGKDCHGFEKECDAVIHLPDIDPHFSAIPSAVVLQLFAYYIAAARQCDIDMPRNLAKSVTVE